MALLESIGVDDANVMFFAVGLASGVIVSVLARARPRPASPSIAQRLDSVELRLASAQLKEHASVLQAAYAARDALPLAAEKRLASLVEMPRRAFFALQERPDGQQVASELFEAMRANVEAAAAIGDAIVKDTNLNDPAERQRIARAVKAAGKKLDASFWDRYGEIIAASGFPEPLKAAFRLFFAHVRSLKAAVDALPNNPTIGDFAPVVEKVVALVETALAIIEELKRVA